MEDPTRTPEFSDVYGGGAGGATAIPHDVRSGKLLVWTGAALAVAGAALVGVYAAGVRSSGDATIPREAIAPARIDRSQDVARVKQALVAAVEHYLQGNVALQFDGKSLKSTWSALGAVVDGRSLERLAADLVEDGREAESVAPDFFTKDKGTIPIAIDRGKGFEILVAMKDSYDRPAVDARMDLEQRRLLPEAPGYGLHVYESLALVEEAARTGAREVALAGGVIDPPITRAQLAGIDISHVVGSFETRYSPSQRDRNHNLRLVAQHLNGKILMPDEKFSFNEVVGDRTEKQGYRVAGVISAGEMVDGLAGGACQISSTLHGAAWFAGLELVRSIPHSRPSTYVTMALDATVVYPTVDLQLRNPYDFPVVIHTKLSTGVVKIEILGKKRPWTRVAFERELKKTIPNATITREDPTMPVGSSIIEQAGFPGYQLVRRRIFYKGRKEAKVEKWEVRYPPTTEYVRIGTNPNPNLVPPKQPSLSTIRPPGKNPIYRMFR